MRTFIRHSLPETITYNGNTYLRDYQLTAKVNAKEIKRSDIPKRGYVKVNVIDKNLYGKKDAFGNPYQDSEWYFKKQV